MTTQVANPKSMVVCVACGTCTHQHETVREAVEEWNDTGGIIWRPRFSAAKLRSFKLKFQRWWHGRNV